jgi:hypothetical protein
VNVKRKTFVLRKKKSRRGKKKKVKAKEVGALLSTVIQGRRDIDVPLGALLGVFLLRSLGPET